MLHVEVGSVRIHVKDNSECEVTVMTELCGSVCSCQCVMSPGPLTQMKHPQTHEQEESEAALHVVSLQTRSESRREQESGRSSWGSGLVRCPVCSTVTLWERRQSTENASLSSGPQRLPVRPPPPPPPLQQSLGQRLTEAFITAAGLFLWAALTTVSLGVTVCICCVFVHSDFQ